MPGIEGVDLDEAEEKLRGRTKADAIHSGALADELGINDSEGNPKTREVIRVLMEERDLPIASGNCGYWLIESREQLDTYVENLQSRIQGIQQRIRMAEQNYEQAIADGGTVLDEFSTPDREAEPDAADVRRAIKRYVEDHDTVMRADLSDAVSTALGCDPVDVQSQLDKMEEAGLAYLVDGEVRLP